MILAFSKILPLLIYPIGLVFLLILISLFIREHRRVQRLLLILSLLVLVLGGNRWIAVWLVRSLEWRYITQSEIQPADVIVVLGGGTENAAYPRKIVEVNSAGDRVIYAAQLYKEGKAKYLLLSGGTINWGEEEEEEVSNSPAEEMKQLLLLLGVPSQAIWLEDRSRNTYENAVYCKEILRERGLEQIILVTSAIHMPRAVHLFTRQGIQVIPAPTDYTVTETTLRNLYEPFLIVQFMNLFPTVGNLSMTTRAMKEYLGLVFYRFQE